MLLQSAFCCATLQQPMTYERLVAKQQSCATEVCNKLIVCHQPKVISVFIRVAFGDLLTTHVAAW